MLQCDEVVTRSDELWAELIAAKDRYEQALEAYIGHHVTEGDPQ